VDIPTVCDPLTVAPDVGYVIDAVKALVDGGGGDVVFETFTVMSAVPVLLDESLTFALSPRLPLATVAVFQLTLGFVPV
jgi:hypothetical protein